MFSPGRGISFAAQTNVVQPESEDRYSVTEVRSALQFLTAPPGTGGTPELKYLNPLLSLGDRVSIAALKIYTPDGLAKTENADAYLTAVRNAFSHAGIVRAKSDRDPRVTLFVLELPSRERDV